MNCEEARRHWDLYHDSEGDAELHFRLNEHLGDCPGCAQWFDQQSRLEVLISQRLAGDSSKVTVDWDNVLAGAGVAPAASSRSWFFPIAVILATAAILLLTIGFHQWNALAQQGHNLSQLSADLHQHVATGSFKPEFASDSDLEVDEFLFRRASFPVRCPPRKDSGFVVQGAGMCDLGTQPAAYVVGYVDDAPVSIFVLPRESLSSFAAERQRLRFQDIHRSREGANETVLSIIDQNLVLVIGEVEPAKLMRVLKSYGTYPHHS